MFAYVKYSDGEKEIVPVSRIRHFNPENVNFNKRYRIEWNEKVYEGVIISLAESEEELEAQITSHRPKVKPLELYQAASDLDSASEEAFKNKKTDESNSMAKEILDSKLSKMKLGARVKESMSHEKVQKAKRTLMGEDKTKKDGLEGRKDGKNQIPCRKDSKSALTSVVAEPRVTEIKQTSDEKNQSKENEQGKNSNESGNISSESTLPVANQEPHGYKKQNNKTINPKNKTMALDISQPPSIKDNLRNDTHTRKNIDPKMDRILKDLEVHKTVVSRLKKSIVDKDIMIKELTQLNVSLQKRVVNEFEELKEILGQLNLRSANGHFMEQLDTLLPIGYRRANDNTIHLGRDIWLQQQIYDSIVCSSRTPSMFVKSMALAIFGTIVLQSSSVTGTVSNRTRKTSNAPARPQLDSTKMLALKDILRFWLTNVKKYDEIAADIQTAQVGTHVSHKIYELNRKKKNVSAMHHENDHHVIENIEYAESDTESIAAGATALFSAASNCAVNMLESNDHGESGYECNDESCEGLE